MRRPLVLVAAAFVLAVGVIIGGTGIGQGVIPGPLVTNYDADVNKDTTINSIDLGIVASRFNQTAPTATATPTSYCNLSGRVLGVLYPDGTRPYSNLSELDLSYCNLAGVESGEWVNWLRHTNFQSANLSNAYFHGFQVDITDSDFSNANLTGARMMDLYNPPPYPRAIFRYADLTNATLSTKDPPGAFTGDFLGAITTGADVSGMAWNDTICPDGTNSDNDGGSCIGHGFAGTPLPTWTPTMTATATATPVPCTGATANAIWAGNGHCYQLFDAPKVFADARTDCESRDGYLVTLTSAEENEFVWLSVAQGRFRYPFIGLTDEVTKGTWLWVTGEPTAYTNWNDNEPGQTVGEDAVLMVPGEGRWNDTYVTGEWEYICETP